MGGSPADANYTIQSPAHKLLFEPEPRAYIPLTDIDGDLLERSETMSHCPFKGDASYWSLRPGDQLRPDASGPTRSRCARRPGCAASPRRTSAASIAGSSRTSSSTAGGCATPTTASTCGPGTCARATRRARTTPTWGAARWWHVHAGGETFPGAAHSYELPRADAMGRPACFSGEGISVELDA